MNLKENLGFIIFIAGMTAVVLVIVCGLFSIGRDPHEIFREVPLGMACAGLGIAVAGFAVCLTAKLFS